MKMRIFGYISFNALDQFFSNNRNVRIVRIFPDNVLWVEGGLGLEFGP